MGFSIKETWRRLTEKGFSLIIQQFQPDLTSKPTRSIMENAVYVVRCPDYLQVDDKINQLMEMMGGIEKYLSPGDRVALKPNLLQAAHPDRAITTHPSLASAVGKMAIEAGAQPFLIDSPTGGYPYTRLALERPYRETGMDGAAREVGLDLNYDTGSQEISFPAGVLTKHFEILTPLLEADVIINLPNSKPMSSWP